MKKLFATLFVTLLALVLQPAQAQDQLTDKMLQRIETAKSALESTTRTINREKRTYADRLSRAEAEVARLRKEAAGIQREADEKLLSLQKLQTRLDQWKNQHEYQRHLLQRHAELTLPLTDHQLTGADILTASLNRLDAVLNPRWRTVDVAMTSGEFTPAQVIEFGPALWYFAAATGSSGLYEPTPGGDQLQSRYEYRGGAHRELEQLATIGVGTPLFDPTQGRAIEIARNNETLWGHLEKGGLWVLPIVFFGLLALVIAALKSVQFFRLPRPTPGILKKLEKLLADDRPQAQEMARKLASGHGNAYRRLVDIVLDHPVSQKRDDLLLTHVNEERKKVTRYLDVISLTAAVAPLLGLLGTVSGMIKTFKMLTIFGSGDPAAVSGGISEALVTTELGLIVAIPALVINAFLSRKARAYMQRLEETAISLSSHGDKTAG